MGQNNVVNEWVQHVFLFGQTLARSQWCFVWVFLLCRVVFQIGSLSSLCTPSCQPLIRRRSAALFCSSLCPSRWLCPSKAIVLLYSVSQCSVSSFSLARFRCSKGLLLESERSWLLPISLRQGKCECVCVFCSPSLFTHSLQKSMLMFCYFLASFWITDAILSHSVVNVCVCTWMCNVGSSH